MGWLLAPALLLLAVMLCVTAEYRIGVGIADVTGPVAGITLMGYGSLEQQGSGIHLRQWSRAFIIEREESRIVIVSVDCAMMSDGVRIQVVEQLMEKYGDVFTMDNIMISATHTHSGVGGYLMHTLFDLPSFGFSQQSFDAMVAGIVKSVEMAYRRMTNGHVYVKQGRVKGANMNRSPTSYQNNPASERKLYKDNVDKEITQVQLFRSDGVPLGAIHWFAVHATSMNNTNTLVSSDNVGYASILFEQKMNGQILLGKGPFVAAFASSNLGDVSPNVLGPLCHPSGKHCHDDSSCDSMLDSCYALGPGEDMFESTRIIGERIFNAAWALWTGGSRRKVTGKVGSVHQYVDMASASVDVFNSQTNTTEKGYGCLPAMGYSFAAGTIDGPFATNIVQQGTNESIAVVNLFRNVVLSKPSQQDHECHAPKPILLFTGGMPFPFDWQPRVVSTQVGQVGQLVLACVPGEFTTMSGRRMRNTVQKVAGSDSIPILVGLCNTYSDYIATFEEYQMQRYEGASTLYGPHTLAIHLDQFENLAKSLKSGEKLVRGPEPKGVRGPKISFVPPVVFDWPGWHRSFGQVLQQPAPIVLPSEIARAVFVSGHPRNGLKLDDTYCTIEIETSHNNWKVLHTDADWETRFHWNRSWTLLGTSTVTVEFYVSKLTEPGTYRIRHFGYFKEVSGDVYPYEGTTNKFLVIDHRNGSCLAKSYWKAMFYLI